MEVEGDARDLFDLDSSEGSTRDEEEFEDGFAIDVIIDDNDDQTSDEEDTQPRFGGYEYEFVDEVSDNQKCPVCLLPMRDAVQTLDCGHRFCKDCLQRILREANPVCPNDRLKIQQEGGYFPDKAWARDILCLRVKCKRHSRGCDWIGQLGHAEDHKSECDYEDERCLACGVDIQRRLKETHHNEECPKRIIECVHCQDEFTFIQKQEHEDTYCRRFPLVCTNNCGHEEIPREEMESHLCYKCPMTEVTCPYAKAGCVFQDKRAYLNDHIEASVDYHLELTWSSLVVAKQELENMKDLRQKFHEIQQVNQKLTESMAESREEVRDLTLTVKSLEIQNIRLKKWMEDMARNSKMANGILTESVAETQKEVLHLKSAIKNLEKQNTKQKTMIEDKTRNMAFGIKSLEIQMDQVNATLAREKAKAQSLSLQKSIPSKPVMLSPYMSLPEESKKVQVTQESPACEKAQFPSFQKSFAAQLVIAASPPSSSSPYMWPREESKKVQDTQESPACEKAQFPSFQKSIATQPVIATSPPSSSSPYMWPREESKKVQDTQESPACEKAQFPSFQKSIATQPVIATSPPSSSSPYMWPREESKKVQDMQESPACEKAQFPSFQKSIATQPVIATSPSSSSSPYTSLREESKKVQDTQESPACEKAQFPSFQKSIATQPVIATSPSSSSSPYMSLREESKKVQDTQESPACEKAQFPSFQKSIATQPVIATSPSSSSSPYMSLREESKKVQDTPARISCWRESTISLPPEINVRPASDACWSTMLN